MKIRKNQRGFIVSIELITLATICVLGLIVGMTDVRDAVLSELSDLSESFGALDQSYQIKGVENIANTAQSLGSQWQDLADTSTANQRIDQNAFGSGVGDSGAASDVTYIVPPTSESETLIPMLP